LLLTAVLKTSCTAVIEIKTQIAAYPIQIINCYCSCVAGKMTITRIAAIINEGFIGDGVNDRVAVFNG
jgi:hypothetical protein